MAWTVEILDEGDNSTNLSSGTTTYFGHLDGAGVPPVRRILVPGPAIHGATDNGFKFSERRMTLHLFQDVAAVARSAGDFDTLRDTLSYIFRPTEFPLKLKITRDDAEVRQIDVFLEGALDFATSGMKTTGRLDIMVPLVAPDPFWYNPTQNVETTSLSSSPQSWTQTAVGITWPDWPIFEATGPLTSLQITNSRTSDSLSFAGNTIAALETYTIDLRPQYKRVEDIAGDSQLSKLTANSKENMFGLMQFYDEKYLATFAVSAPQTTNRWQYTASSTTGASEVVAYWYDRFLSV